MPATNCAHTTCRLTHPPHTTTQHVSTYRSHTPHHVHTHRTLAAPPGYSTRVRALGLTREVHVPVAVRPPLFGIRKASCRRVAHSSDIRSINRLELERVGAAFFFLRRPLCAGEALVAQAAGPGNTRGPLRCAPTRMFSSRGCKVVAAQKGTLSKLGN